MKNSNYTIERTVDFICDVIKNAVLYSKGAPPYQLETAALCDGFGLFLFWSSEYHRRVQILLNKESDDVRVCFIIDKDDMPHRRITYHYQLNEAVDLAEAMITFIVTAALPEDRLAMKGWELVEI